MTDDRLYQRLSDILENWQQQSRRWPVQMPRELCDAVPWWINMQEAAGKHETPYRKAVLGKDGELVWMFPYIERLAYTLQQFLHMPHDAQKTIIAAREDSIFWRGDDMPFFTRVIHETLRMREIGLDAYKAESRTKARAALKQHQQRRNNAA
ncbi:hypothetical protein [Primorskyibacter sedentarius]|uniref:hypothetical protein n=1 Tax=Primorskyibacter sedentarius TaxID=745311 RepID=UPI003EBD9903